VLFLSVVCVLFLSVAEFDAKRSCSRVLFVRSWRASGLDRQTATPVLLLLGYVKEGRRAGSCKRGLKVRRSGTPFDWQGTKCTCSTATVLNYSFVMLH